MVLIGNPHYTGPITYTYIPANLYCSLAQYKLGTESADSEGTLESCNGCPNCRYRLDQLSLVPWQRPKAERTGHRGCWCFPGLVISSLGTFPLGPKGAGRRLSNLAMKSFSTQASGDRQDLKSVSSGVVETNYPTSPGEYYYESQFASGSVRRGYLRYH